MSERTATATWAVGNGLERRIRTSTYGPTAAGAREMRGRPDVIARLIRHPEIVTNDTMG